MNFFRIIPLYLIALLLSISTSAQCDNGNIEYGNFTNWTGYTSFNTNGTVLTFSMTNQIVSPDRHSIAGNGYDPIVGGNVLSTAYNGNYSLKLGSTNDIGKRAQVARYPLRVTANNAHFSFAYAVVLEDGHPIDPSDPYRKNPFFTYWYSLSADVQNSMTGSNLIHRAPDVIADVNNPFFSVVPGKSVVYTQWQTVCYDFSQYIGQTVYIYYYTAGCTEDGHWGYAYIDGLCDNNGALPYFSLPKDIKCASDLVANGTGSTGEQDYFWQVSALASNNPNDVIAGTEKSETTYNAPVGIIDLYRFYTGKGGTFSSSGYYKITLGVRNCSGVWTTREVVIYLQAPVLYFADVYRCCESNDKIVFHGYQYLHGNGGSAYDPSKIKTEWYDLDGNFLGNGDNHLELAPVQQSPFGNQYIYTYTFTPPTNENAKYVVKYTDPDDCSNQSYVRVINKPTALIPKITSNYCAISCQLPTTLTAGADYDENYKCRNKDPKINDEIWPLATDESFLTYKWSTGETSKTINIQPGITTYSVEVSNGCSKATATYVVGRESIMSGNLPDFSDYNVPGNVNTSHSMTPNNPTKRFILYQWGIAFGASPAYNAYAYDIEIYDRWGNTVYSAYVQAPCKGFKNNEIAWSGQTNHYPYPSSGFVQNMDTYFYRIVLHNCNGRKQYSGNFEVVF